MTEVGKIRNGPAGRGLAYTRPNRHPLRVDAMQAKKRLGTLVRGRRKSMGLDSQKQLAEATGLSEATIQIVESGRRTAGSQVYTSLEEFFGIPIGTMEKVLAGQIRTFPDGEPLEVERGDDTYTHGDQVFTRADLAVLIKALGDEGFIAWAKGPGQPDAPASGT